LTFLMEIILSKRETITFVQKTKPANGECKLHNLVLSTVTSAKYLRVHLSSKLPWNDRFDISQQSLPEPEHLQKKLLYLSIQHALIVTARKAYYLKLIKTHKLIKIFFFKVGWQLLFSISLCVLISCFIYVFITMSVIFNAVVK